MKNCVITEFKGVIDNDNLPVFNVLKFKVAPGTLNLYLYGITNKSTLSFDNTVDSLYDGTGGSPISSPYTQVGPQYIRLNGTLTRETEFEYTPLYECAGIKAIKGIVNSFSGINSIVYAPIKSFEFRESNTGELLDDSFNILKLLNLPNIQEIYLNKLTHFAVDLDSLNANSNLVTLALTQSRPITGHLSAIVSKFPNLSELALNETSVVGNLNDLLGLSNPVTNKPKALQRNADITGTVESFAETLCASHTSGYFMADLRYTSVTFGQTPQTIENYTNDYIFIRFSATGCTVEDNSSNVKGTYNKSTGTWTYA